MVLFYFPLFWGIVMYDKAMIMTLKQKKKEIKPRKKIEPQHNTLNNKALRWNISQFVWTLFLFVCYCLLFSQRVSTTCVMNSFFSILGILWSHAEVKVSELKVSSTGETYSIGNWIGFFSGHETPRPPKVINQTRICLYFFRIPQKKDVTKKVPLQPYSSTLIDMWLCQAVGWKRM